MYSRAAGEPFSFSALTNPFGINVTWSYLLKNYGERQYGYLPTFFGPPQDGLVGAGTLAEVSEPADIHFTIYEPDTQLPEFLIEELVQTQNEYLGSPSAQLKVGSLELEERGKN